VNGKVSPRRILETVLYADDLAAAHQFYTEVLGLEVLSYNPERSIFFKVGSGMLIVFRAEKTLIPDAGVPTHGTTGPGHMAFGASRDEIDEWRDQLIRHGIEIEMEKSWSNGAFSIYFRDPAGNSLEFATPDLWFS
jgi:catechol 2,3-dioxygenase-like lactoylglutathione lyase family enzyme